MFYDNLQKLCSIKGVSPSKALEELSMSKGNLGKWQNGVEPSNRTKRTLANYFGVTIETLMSGEITEAPEPKNALAFRADNTQLTKREEQLVLAYRKASADDRAVIDFIVEKYINPNPARKEMEAI